MIGVAIKVKEGFGRFLGGLGKRLLQAGREAGEEISTIERPAPRDEAEEALWQAMGWADPEGEDSGKVVGRKWQEVISEQ